MELFELLGKLVAAAGAFILYAAFILFLAVLAALIDTERK